MNKTAKRILCLCVVLCLFFLMIPFVSSADPVSAIALASAIDAYGMAYGVGTTYDVTSTAGIDSSFNDLWSEFSTYASANNIGDYDTYIAEWNNKRVLDSFSHSSGNFACWHIDAESAEVFDQFWNWLLTGPAQMTTVDNQFSWTLDQQTGNINPITVIQSNGLAAVPQSTTPLSNGIKVFDGANNSASVYYSSSTSSTFVFTDGTMTYICSSSPFTLYTQYSSWSSPNNSYYNVNASGVASSNIPTPNGKTINSAIPIFSSAEDGYSALAGSNDQSVSVKNYPSMTDPALAQITLPVVTDPNYQAKAVDLVTSIPWDDTYNPSDVENGVPVPWTPSDVPQVLDDMANAIFDDTYELTEEEEENPPVPQEVILPFLPVALPSFNFSFSGIWHYVREWVASMASWFTAMFSMWSALPYVMVVPVYATAVVVIVLGVYKRFFM